MSNSATPPGGTVLITGAASGIGKAAALLFARRGWRCVLLDQDAGRLQQLLGELVPHPAGPHLCRVLDLTDPAAIQALGADLPALDALVNNAGMSHSGASALEPLDDGVPARLLSLNLAAPVRMVQACARHLRVGARVVNVASGAGLRAIPHRGLYSPSKAGLLAQTHALARARPEWTVTALAPGFVRTELVQHLMDGGKLDPAQAVAKIPLGRMAEPWELAEAMFFLATQAPGLLAGQTLSVCGGSSVYGGSQPLAPARSACLPADAPLHLQAQAPLVAAWQHIAPVGGGAAAPTGACLGWVDGTPWQAPAGQVLRAAQEAASVFRQRQATGPASLTLLLPARQVPWEYAGDVAAARMLVSTLAAEWGASGWRINAVVVADDTSPGQCEALLRFMAGAGAQYLTGQTLRLTPCNTGDTA